MLPVSVLVAELLLPSYLMWPFTATGYICTFIGMAVWQTGYARYAASAVCIICCAPVAFIVLACGRLPMLFGAWLAVIMVSPQEPMLYDSANIGFFAVAAIPRDEPGLHEKYFPAWWSGLHACWGLLGAILFYYSLLDSNVEIDLSGWSWPCSLLFKGLFGGVCVPCSVLFAVELKQSSKAIPLLIVAPARWKQTSLAVLVLSVALSLMVARSQWTNSVKMLMPWVPLETQAELLQSATVGVSFMGAWVGPWMIAAFSALFNNDDSEMGLHEFFDRFLDQLLPAIDVPSQAHGASLNSLDLQPGSIGHIVLEATNIIAARQGVTDSLVSLLQAAHPTTTIETVAGPRHYARAKIQMEDEEIIKRTIKQLARDRGKRTTIKTVERVFYSPRD